MSVEESMYHMQGKDGIFNMKFLSYNSFCEAVYNKKGTAAIDRGTILAQENYNAHSTKVTAYRNSVIARLDLKKS